MWWVKSSLTMMLLAFAVQGCGTPAKVTLYDERQERARAADRQVASRSDNKWLRAPVPRSKPSTGASSRSRIESRELPPPGKQQALNTATRSAVKTDTVTAHDRRPAGQYQPVPKTGVHVVKPKETVYAISRRYGVPVRSLLVINRLQPPYILKLGQRIQVPAQRQHVVSKGETVYAISRRYNVSIKELVRLNGVGTPPTIKTGQTLLLPDSEGAVVQPASLPIRPAPDAAPPASREHSAPPRTKTVVLPPSTNIPRPAKLSGKGFLWPVSGRIISGFGRKARGLHNDGINIAAPRGTPVRAAQNGVIAYHGNELRGFGKLILIKHAKGYMTAYAHTEQVLVKRGQRVRRGQVIARVGSSGSVAVPQLHFEIRKGRRAVNPTKYLRHQRAAAPGKRSPG